MVQVSAQIALRCNSSTMCCPPVLFVSVCWFINMYSPLSVVFFEFAFRPTTRLDRQMTQCCRRHWRSRSQHRTSSHSLSSCPTGHWRWWRKIQKGALKGTKMNKPSWHILTLEPNIYIYVCVCFFLLFIYCHSLLWNYGFLRTFPLAKIFLGLSLNPTHHHLALHRIHQSWSSKLTLTLWSCISPIITYHFGIIRFAYIITMRILKVMLATCINTEDLQKYIYICIYIYMYICIYIYMWGLSHILPYTWSTISQGAKEAVLQNAIVGIRSAVGQSPSCPWQVSIASGSWTLLGNSNSEYIVIYS